MGMLGQSQNLVNPIKIEKIEPLGKPPGFYKSIVLHVLGIAAALFAGYAYSEFLGSGWPLFAPIGALFLFAIILTLEALLGNKIWRRIGMLAIEAIALCAPFYASDIRILAACAAVAFVFLAVGYLQSRSELSHSATIRFFGSTHGVVAKTVTAALLVAIILYLPMANAGAVFVGEPAFNGFFNWAAGFVGNFYPNVPLTGSFDDFVQNVARGELANNATFGAMSAENQAVAVSAAAGQIKSSLSKSFGVTLSAASSTSDVVYRAIQNILQGWHDRFSIWFIAGWGIVLFLVLRSFGGIATWIGQFLAMIVYEILLSAGVIRIVEEPQTKETIEF